MALDSLLQKGDRVTVYATVDSLYGPGYDELLYSPTGKTDDYSVRSLFRMRSEPPWEGLVVGVSYRATGIVSIRYDGSAYLKEDKRHKVWMVIPLQNDRYVLPRACLEKDLIVKDADTHL